MNLPLDGTVKVRQLPSSAPARDAQLIPAAGDFNLGDSEHNFRVPDGGLHRSGVAETWLATAALVIEIVSPNDESWDKLPFYAAHNVDEVLIVDPAKRSIDWLALTDGEYRPVEHSGLIRSRPTRVGEADRMALIRIVSAAARKAPDR